LRHPEHADVIARVLALPAKRFDRALINFLTKEEVHALLLAPDRGTWTGRRDHALLLTAIQTGLRVSELTGLRCQDVRLGTISYLFTKGNERFADPQPGASQHDDQAAEPDSVGVITGSAHDGDDLLDGRGVRWISEPFVAGRSALVVPG
jgi:hypothetical protein